MKKIAVVEDNPDNQLLVAHAMAGDRDRYLGAGFNDYVTKPIVDETILLATIERLLNAREVR